MPLSAARAMQRAGSNVPKLSSNPTVLRLPSIIWCVAKGQRRVSPRTVSVRCHAARTKTVRQRRGSEAQKGFGTPTKRQQPWEEQLLPAYRVYYKPGFKPPRFQGPIELKKFEDGSVGVVASDNATGAELLAVSHPLAFMEGSLGTSPPVEDLHVSLLESELSPAISKVLSYLPRRPAGAAVQPPAATASADAADAAVSTPTVQQQPLRTAAVEQQEMPPSMAHLLVPFWDRVGTFGFDKLSSKQLMRMLQASCWSEEVQDPAASQVRHERPTGFIGIWPEFALMRHSCTPNTSVVVVNRYMLLHATDEIPADQEFTANKLGGVIAAPIAARQAAHVELFGRPCHCSRCQLEQQLPEEVQEQLQAVHDKAQADWPNRLQSALESAEAVDPEATADLLSELQAEIALELESLDEVLAESISDADDRRLVLCGVYAAYDLAWQMEELLQETPDLDTLTNCVALLRLFARGSEGHVYSAMVLDELYSARAQALSKEAARRKSKTLARQKQLTTQIQRLLAEAQTAAFATAEAITCRYGLLPDEGLVQQLQQGLTMFYTGMSALSAAKGDNSDAVPEMTRNLTIEGVPVTVVDTVEGSAFAGDEKAEVGRSGSAAAGQRVKVDWLEASQDLDEQRLGDAAALEAAAEQALAEAVAQIEAEGATGQQLAASA